jgi:hypothetical protein
MSALNEDLPSNKSVISVIKLVFHCAIYIPLPSVQFAPVASLPPKQYEDAIVSFSWVFEANGDAYVHSVLAPPGSSPSIRKRPLAHAVHVLLKT